MDDRLHRRFVTEQKFHCRIGDEISVYLPTYDLSRSGCMVRASQRLLGTGDPVILTLLGRQVDGLVAWQRAGCAGIAFSQLLPEAMVELLGFDPIKEINWHDCLAFAEPQVLHLSRKAG